MLKNATIKIKLFLLISVPLIAFLLFAVDSIYTSHYKLSNVQKIDTLLKSSQKAVELIFSIQKERALNVEYLTNQNSIVKEKLLKQQKQTNDEIIKLKQLITNKKLLNYLNKLKETRQNINHNNLNIIATIDFYTSIVSNLLNIPKQMILNSNDKQISQVTLSISKLLITIENAEQEKIILNHIFTGNKLTSKQFQKFIFANAAQKENLSIYKSFSKTFTANIDSAEYKNFIQTMQLKIKKNDILSEIKTYMGYGGLIHNFKNFVLRKTPKYKNNFFDKKAKLDKLITEYKTIENLTPNEIKRIDDIQNTINEYASKFNSVINMTKNGKTTEYIDKIVKISDKEAIEALHNLSTKVVGINTSTWQSVSTVRINNMIKLYYKDLNNIQEIINKNKHQYNNTFLTILAIVIILIILITAWFLSITSGFANSLKKLDKGIEDFILFTIYRDKKIADIKTGSNDEIGKIAQHINKNMKILEACFRCDERVISEVSKAVKNAKNDIHLVEEIKCFADNVMLENMKFDFNEMIEIIKTKTYELNEYKKNLEQIIETKTNELANINKELELKVEIRTQELKDSHKVLEDEKNRLNSFSTFLSTLNSVDIGYLANKALNQILNISDSLLGFFIIYENNKLKVLSSKAIDNTTLEINEDLIVNSPLILESLKQNRIIDIEEFGYNVLKPINIGLGEIEFNSFYSFPLTFQEKPLGLIVLASAKIVDKEYVQGYIQALSSSLNNATSYNYIQQQSLKLEQANLELKESDKMKSEFLANMSHELRTPLNSIIGFSSILGKNKKENLDTKQVDQVYKINNNGKHLLGLINDILDLSKIESGKMELDPKNTNIVQLVQDTVGMLSGQADSKQVTLSFENRLDKDSLILNIDDGKLRQVIVNLIGNALKFVEPSTGVVTVFTLTQNDILNISIQDNGIGIPEDKLELIFEAFRQADGSTTRKYGGTGLGLAISKNMVELLGGNITVQSTVGEGATFSINLPINENNISNTDNKILNDVKATQKIINKTEMKSILIIDDTEDSRNLIEEYVKDYEDITIYTATNGEEGLEIARKVNPSLITLDIMMPKMNGWEVLKEIETDDKLKNTPIIVISNVLNENKALSLGATACLNKPISKNDLTTIIKQNFNFPVSKILIVDDEPDIQDIMVEMVSSMASNIKVASNGKEAYDILESGFIPEMIFLDLMMPEFSGFDFLNMIKYQDKYQNLNIVVISAKDFTKEDMEFLNKRNIPLVKKNSEVEVAVKKALQTI